MILISLPGGALQHPITGRMFGCEKILKQGRKNVIHKMFLALQISDKKMHMVDEQITVQTYLSFGNSSLKSRDILGVHSRRTRIFATISFPCHRPFQVWLEGDSDNCCVKERSFTLIPLCRDNVASP